MYFASICIGYRGLLQNKKDRYYFSDSINLKEGQIYVSIFDLNIEQGEIEIPYKPIIRFSTPIYNSNNIVVGVIVLNYYGSYLLDSFKNISDNSNGNIYLLNSSGYWLSQNDPKKEWGFMFESKKDISFGNEFIEEWKIIKNNDIGQFYSKNGLFTYSEVVIENTIKNINPIRQVILKEDNWKIVSYISKNSSGYLVEKNIDIILRIFIEKSLYIVIIFFFSLIISTLIVLNNISKKEVKYFAEYDSMTKVLNRRAGLKSLELSYQKAVKERRKFSICFVDINGLKDINDTLGHKFGDELILTVVNVLKNNIREEDYIVRLGGDEFLIVFNEIDANTAEIIWQRILNEYDTINNKESRKYLVSVSHGIAEMIEHYYNNADTLINIADSKMYEEKREIKKNIKIIKSV